MQRLLASIDTLRGWRGKLACFAAGALTAASFAPIYAWPVLFVTIPFLFLMLDKARHWRSSALYALAFGYGYFMAGTYWIAYALAVDIEKFGWMIPLSVLGLSLVVALWFALFGALVRATRAASLTVNLLRFAILWVAVEYWRSLGMFGFPWNLLGSTTMVSLPIAQLGSVVGPYGVSLFTVLIALVPVFWLRQSPQRKPITVAALVVVASVYGWGAWRMPASAELTNTTIRIVQGSIPQTLKWTEEGRRDSAHIYGTLSRLKPEGATPDILVWPETALPFTLREYSPWVAQMAQLLPPGGLLVTGAVRSSGEGESYRLYNSIAVIDARGTWHASYDKHQLVPFGEFVPLRHVLPLDKITPGNIDFSRGQGVRTLHIGDMPSFSPLICYEAVFPWLAADRHDRPEWLFNATNDGWYGTSPGPHQHFDMARMRAIEQGLPMVRAANTGISAVIDPYGRPIKWLELNERGIIDQQLPHALRQTIYAKTGDVLILLVLLCVWLVTKLLLFRLRK